jgi:REP element-mobilizing transposase RayT
MADRASLDHTYEYRRRLPHFQKPDRAVFVTFCKNNREPFSSPARDLVLQHCIHDHGKRIHLHAAVVMPEHTHLLLTPMEDEQGWPYSLATILKRIKGVSARSVNRSLQCSGSVWQEESFDHVLRSAKSFAEKLEYIRQNPVRRGLVLKPEDYRWLWVEQFPYGTDTPVRRL